MSITYKIIGKIKAPIPDDYQVVGTVNNLVVDYGVDRKNVYPATSKIIAKSPRCINYGFNRKIKEPGSNCPCPGGTCKPNKVCKKDRVIPALILEE